MVLMKFTVVILTLRHDKHSGSVGITGSLINP